MRKGGVCRFLTTPCREKWPLTPPSLPPSLPPPLPTREGGEETKVVVTMAAGTRGREGGREGREGEREGGREERACIKTGSEVPEGLEKAGGEKGGEVGEERIKVGEEGGGPSSVLTPTTGFLQTSISIVNRFLSLFLPFAFTSSVQTCGTSPPLFPHSLAPIQALLTSPPPPFPSFHLSKPQEQLERLWCGLSPRSQS